MNRQNLLALGLVLCITTGCHSMGGGSCLSRHKRDKCEELPCQCEQCYRPLYPGDTWGQHHGRKHSKRHKHDHKQVYAMSWANGAGYGYGSHGGPVQVQFGYPVSDCGCVDSMTAGWADDCGCGSGCGGGCGTYAPCGCDSCSAPQMMGPPAMSFQMAGPSCGAPVGPTCSAPVAASCAVPAPSSCAMPGVITPTPDCATQQLMVPGNSYEQSFPAAVPPAESPMSDSEKIPMPPQETPVEQNFHAPKVNPPAEQNAPAADPIQQTSWNTLQVPPAPFPPVPNINVPQGSRVMIRRNLTMPTP